MSDAGETFIAFILGVVFTLILCIMCCTEPFGAVSTRREACQKKALETFPGKTWIKYDAENIDKKFPMYVCPVDVINGNITEHHVLMSPR